MFLARFTKEVNMTRYTALFLLFVAPALMAAADCDPYAILKKENVTRYKTQESGLAYASQLHKTSESKEETDISILVPIQGVPVKLGISDAASYFEYLQSSIGYTYSQKETDYFYREHLSDNQLQAWKDCLNAEGVSFSLEKDAYKDDTFTVIVNWKISGPTIKQAKVRLTTTNGIVAELDAPLGSATSHTAQSTILPNSSAEFLVTDRDVQRKVEIIVSVSGANKEGKKSIRLTLPPYHAYKVTSAHREAPMGGIDGNDYRWNVSGETCLRVQPGEHFMTGTAEVTGSRFGGGTTYEITQRKPEVVCAVIMARNGDGPRSGWTSATLSARAVKITPD